MPRPYRLRDSLLMRTQTTPIARHPRDVRADDRGRRVCRAHQSNDSPLTRAAATLFVEERSESAAELLACESQVDGDRLWRDAHDRSRVGMTQPSLLRQLESQTAPLW